jgi:thioredoxin reductase
MGKRKVRVTVLEVWERAFEVELEDGETFEDAKEKVAEGMGEFKAGSPECPEISGGITYGHTMDSDVWEVSGVSE